MPENRREFMLLDEVAGECRAPVASVRYWIATGRLRSIKPGRRRLVSRHERDRFLDSAQTVRGPGEPERQA